MSEKLKACPFCGKEAETGTDMRWNKPSLKIYHKPDCVFSQGAHSFCEGIPEHDDYINKWNTRAQSQAEVEMWDALADVLCVALMARVLDEEELVITSKAAHILAKYQKGYGK